MECPRCKEEIVVGRVCPVCGYIVEDEASTQSSREITEDMEILLNNIKSLPDVSLKSVFSNYMTWLLPLIAIGFLCMSLISEAGLFWILFAITAVFSIWKIISFVVKSSKSDSNGLEGLINDMESLIRTVRREYAYSSEMIKIAQDFENQIYDFSKRREASIRRARLISIIISIAIVVVIVLGIFGIYSLVA